MPEIFDNHRLTNDEYINTFKHDSNPAIREGVQRMESIQDHIKEWEDQDTYDDDYISELEFGMAEIRHIINDNDIDIPPHIVTEIRNIINRST